MRTTGRLQAISLAIYFWAFIAFLFLPLVVLLIFSVNDSTTPTLPLSGFTTKWFHLAFGNGALTTALVRSIAVGCVSAIIATMLAIVASLGLLTLRGRAASLALTILLLPLVVPYICLAVGLLILVQALGANPSLTAVVLGHAVIALPFAILVILPRLRSLDPAMNEAALDLGSSHFAALRLITMPLLMPALVSAFIISFVTSFDEFAIASFLAPPGQQTYPLFLYASARSAALLPELIAIGALIIGGSILLVGLAEGGRHWAERRMIGAIARAGDTEPDLAPELSTPALAASEPS